MMVSLAGTKCVLTNQWSCTLAENTNKLELTMKGRPRTLRFTLVLKLTFQSYLLSVAFRNVIK